MIVQVDTGMIQCQRGMGDARGMAIRVQSGWFCKPPGQRFDVRGVTREGNTTMNYKRVAGVVGGVAAGAAVVGSEIAKAQDDLGAQISGSVGSSVSGISTSSGGSASGGTQVEHNEVHLGEQEGLAISDASGGNHNISFVS